jgi:hypothetical protein
MESTSMAPRTALPRERVVASTINLLLGIWLFIAGFALAAHAPAMRNDVIVGVLIFIFAAWRLSRTAPATPSWLNFILGIWLLFAPWSLHYASSDARWNDFAVGCAVIILSIISGVSRGRMLTRTTANEANASTYDHRRAA